MTPLPGPLADLVGSAGLGPVTPGFAAALQHGDEPPTYWCVGVRDPDRRPITPETNFRLASITKQFTAAAVLRLVEQGAVGLDTTVDQVLPEYPRPIAIRHLLTHRSGVPDYEEHLPAGDGQVTDEQVVEILAGID